MVYFSEKTIKGNKYLYAVESVRINKKIKKIMKRVEKPAITRELIKFFDNKKNEIIKNEHLKKYKSDAVFSKEQMTKIDKTRANYKTILKKLSKAQKKDLFDRFTANFTYESNAIEGNSLTLKDVSLVLFENRVIKGKDLPEIYETRNSRKVVDLILSHKFRISEKDIIKMHRLLVKDMNISTGYKKIPNYLLWRKVKTAPPEKVHSEMKMLIDWFNEQKNIHPLQKAALFHGRFEKIHPFDDGNGRVGRFIVNVILVDSGYAPLIIRKMQRIAYFKALEDFDGGYTRNLERFMLEKYKKTFKNFFQIYIKYLK